MNSRYLSIVVFIAGVSAGWAGKSWLDALQVEPSAYSAASDPLASSGVAVTSRDLPRAINAISANPDGTNSPVDTRHSARTSIRNIPDASLQPEPQTANGPASGTATVLFFQKLLNDRRYFDAMNLYQEQDQQNSRSITRLKEVLLDQLNVLSKNRTSSDFSELVENYLSVYYDDIDVLLQLADFNQSNGNYYEVIDVYLLALTYAYTDIDQQKVIQRFDGFIKQVDNWYASQQDWFSLINLYSHINTSGLTTSSYQYQQAVAYLRSGDEQFAAQQFTQLLHDGVVGELAATALNRLQAGNSNNGALPDSIGLTASVENSAWESAETIALQQVGNQFVVDLTINRQDDIKLLIDTGASLTTLSRVAFQSLSSASEAVETDRRLFRTAGGVIMGTVYTVSEIKLGGFSMQDTQVAVLDFEMRPGVDGLLGMNILGDFRFQIDQENTSLILSR